ncbi:polyphenol oxidase family protein [Paeniglutamicibacter psychrophenolicus]|uniref:polyphenol oxidase family protein n=1 Tax=Paeniglutamicibacter psychrophenolicus TaxID=257454 RepID=UPI00278B1A9A|nr:polyphenol oxidase family protein [Paeniglutamicibacter psychrophenolicus]MDQ0094386.1 YfiH family protein [Paeniglutamicibacter psychrophenolicus]
MLRYQSTLAPSVHIAFTSVAEGNLAVHVPDDRDAVLLRRRDLEQDLGLGPKRFSYMNQIHSATVLEVAEGSRDTGIPTCDALFSPDAASPLAVMVADCVPVVFVGTGEHGALSAVAHAGRRGLLDGILGATAERLRAAGARQLEAWIGPAICGACYEVPEAMAAEASGQRPGIGSRTRQGTTGLDLPHAAAAELRDLGVSVTESGICTLENEDYFSYRRDPGTGRLAGLVWDTATPGWPGTGPGARR